MTSDGDKLYEYDALGRLTYAASNANTNVELARYAYDALGRLAMQITYDYQQDAADPYDQLNTTRYFYYDTPDVGGISGGMPSSPLAGHVSVGTDGAADRPILPQVIEQRNGDGDVTDQFIWGPAYVDELLTHDRDTDGDGSVDERLYATHDRLYSVLSLVDEDGEAIEHYEYSPYGADPLDPRQGFAAITDADTALPLSAEMSAAQYLYTGRSFDKVIGLNHHRARRLSHNLGRWNRADPLGTQPSTHWGMGTPTLGRASPIAQFSDGPNLYAYVSGMASTSKDPDGLRTWLWSRCGSWFPAGGGPFWARDGSAMVLEKTALDLPAGPIPEIVVAIGGGASHTGYTLPIEKLGPFRKNSGYSCKCYWVNKQWCKRSCCIGGKGFEVRKRKLKGKQLARTYSRTMQNEVGRQVCRCLSPAAAPRAVCQHKK